MSKKRWIEPAEFVDFTGEVVEVKLRPGVWGRLLITKVDIVRAEDDSPEYAVDIQARPA